MRDSDLVETLKGIIKPFESYIRPDEQVKLIHRIKDLETCKRLLHDEVRHNSPQKSRRVLVMVEHFEHRSNLRDQ